ncbi:TetR/AcrR family transcriptional regulator [Mucilaginibacter limnophilus]|nr:TetR/AcrR family transcriptional regulator [Mucilaginibacter limnophilus]
MKNKEATKRKLIDAIGVIINAKGFEDIRISRVARIAEVDRKLVYRYFGNLNNLIEAYILENDYWMIFAQELKKLAEELTESNYEATVSRLLEDLFRFFIQEPKMQNLILIELSNLNPLMRSIHNLREDVGQQFFEKTDPYFHRSEVNFRAVAALLVGGIYYIILHTRKNGYVFADLDLKSEEGTKEILKAVSQIISWAFKDAQAHRNSAKLY